MGIQVQAQTNIMIRILFDETFWAVGTGQSWPVLEVAITAGL